MNFLRTPHRLRLRYLLPLMCLASFWMGNQTSFQTSNPKTQNAVVLEIYAEAMLCHDYLHGTADTVDRLRHYAHVDLHKNDSNTWCPECMGVADYRIQWTPFPEHEGPVDLDLVQYHLEETRVAMQNLRCMVHAIHHAADISLTHLREGKHFPTAPPPASCCECDDCTCEDCECDGDCRCEPGPIIIPPSPPCEGDSCPVQPEATKPEKKPALPTKKVRIPHCMWCRI